MKKRFMALMIGGVMLASILTACGGGNTESASSTPADLTGTWRSEDNDGSYQEAIIATDSMEIYWVSDGGDTKSLYWAGTYAAPTEPGDYSWTSERDAEKTDTALLASTDDTKDFSYSDGKISYEVSAFGTTTKTELEKVEE